MDFIWNQIAIKIFFPNDVGLPPTFLKHVSNQSEFILKYFNFLGIYLWEFEIIQIFDQFLKCFKLNSD